MCLYKADTYISTNLSRYIDGFHIQMVFNQVGLVWQQPASSKIPPCRWQHSEGNICEK